MCGGMREITKETGKDTRQEIDQVGGGGGGVGVGGGGVRGR